MISASHTKKAIPYLKNNLKLKGLEVWLRSQAIGSLPSMGSALTSNPNTTGKEKKEKQIELKVFLVHLSLLHFLNQCEN
jgi:hypothetical protein